MARMNPVKKAYAESWFPHKGYKMRNLNFKGRFTTKKKAEREVGYIGKSYNEFTPSRGRWLINSAGVKKVRIAREQSVAMYFETSRPYHLIGNAQIAKADEMNIVGKKGKNSIVRLWWD